MRRILITAVICLMASTAYAGGLTAEEQNFTRAFETLRAKYNLAMPSLDTSLVEGSRSWSARMRTTGRFSHGASQENIYQGRATGVAAFRAWERSPGHRALLLSPNVEAFGIGQSDGFWTFRARHRERESVTASAPVVRQTYTSAKPCKRPLHRCLKRLCR